jgi:hypothetical protein
MGNQIGKIFINSLFLLTIIACGSSDRDAESNPNIFISGTVSLASGNNFFTQKLITMLGLYSPADVTLGNFFMYCQTLDETANTASTKLGSDGGFNLQLKNAKNVPVNCFIVSLLTEYVVSILFQDPTRKDLNGESLEFPYLSFSENTELEISANFGTGKAVADISNLTTISSPSTTLDWDLSGTWKFEDLTSNLPTTFSGLCEAGESQYTLGSAATCWGPEVDQTFFFKQIDGVVEGTTSAQALMIWKNEDAFDACGSTLGNTYTNIETSSEIDFSDSGVDEGNFTFENTLTGTDTLTDFWKSSEATAASALPNCAPHTINATTYWRCADGLSGNYRVENFEGCANATFVPKLINISNWASVVWASDAITDDDDFKLNTMSGLIGTDARTCLTRYAFTDGSDAINNALTFNWNNVAEVRAQGQSCSGISGAYPLAKLYCYAQFYKTQLESATGCVKDMRFDTSTSVENDFVVTLNKPRDLYSFNRVDSPGNGLKSVVSESSETLSVQFKDSAGKVGYAFCPVKYRHFMSFYPSNSDYTEALVAFQSEAVIQSDSTICKAHVVNSLNGEFYIVSESDAVLVSRQKVFAKIVKQ